MKTMTKIALLIVMAASIASCVQSREPRNGVFNENVYLRKDFLIRSGDSATSTDPGWMLKATIVSTSSPNPLSMGANGFVSGYHSGGQLVRFRVLQDHLDMLDMREINSDTDPTENVGKVPEVANSWGVTNVDLQYQVSLDGEKTNFYQENQERPWEQRQWVKLNLAKNDMSDVAAMGYDFYELLNACADVGESSSVLQPESVFVNENTGYLEWTVQLTVPFLWNAPGCAEAYGSLGTTAALIDRQNVTMNLKYSLTRADPAPTYQPFVIAEKDPIRHKYGPLTTTVVNRDINTGLLAAQEFVTRHDPSKPIVYYFDKDFPADFKQTFLDPDHGIVKQTNDLLTQSGAAARLSVLDYNANIPDNWTDAEKARGREFGDVRFNFIRWMKDQDLQPGWVGVTQFVTDPRNGLVVDTDVIVNELNQATYMYWYDQFLASVGASTGDLFGPGEWSDPPSGPTCQDGDTLPLVPDDRSNWIGTSTLFSKMQTYLGRDPALWGNLGPTDFVDSANQNDPDFLKAYYTLLPYEVFADPDANQFVTREGGAGVYGSAGRFGQLVKEAQFHKVASDIDHGFEPYDSSGTSGIANAAAFLNNFRSLTTTHHTLDYQNLLSMRSQLRMAEPSGFTFEQMMLRSARHCVGSKWETKAEYLKHMHDSYWTFTLWHEFGHSIGLDHNFMASVDAPNFPHYKDGVGRDHIAMYSSSAMEYPGFGDDFFWHQGWGPYDRGAIAWIYANNGSPVGAQGVSISGQVDATKPWKDPAGFDTTTGKEIQYLRCDASHIRYTPLCRQFDEGTTPSEIMANDITRYEWTYQYRNFRAYRKYWNESGYANSPAGAVYDMRKFISLWVFDWSGGEIQDTLRRVGLTNPDPNGSDAEYFQQLDDKFNAELSMTNQMVAAFHKGIIQQGSGERPFATIYDKFYGDVTQQGIILDKLFAMQGWVGMWPTDNYDQNQAGFYLASYSGIGDSSYNSVAEDTVDSMIGGQYNVYPYFKPLAVTQFAQDTHDPSFSGRLDVRDWTGGQPFTRLQDFLDYFRNIAVQQNYQLDGCDTGFDTCKYDPRDHSDTHHEFIAPDKRVYIWSFVPDRNMYISVQKDRNTASYIIVRSYNDDVVNQLDDGALPGNAYGLELPMKYFMDSFNYFR